MTAGAWNGMGFGITVWASGWRYGLRDGGMGFGMAVWASEWRCGPQNDGVGLRITVGGPGMKAPRVVAITFVIAGLTRNPPRTARWR
jgi:hypothetical protein